MYAIRIVWSDDTITLTPPMGEWFANWMLHIFGDSATWVGQIRPIRAILVRVNTPEPERVQ